MIIDAFNTFLDAEAVNASTGSALRGKVVDLADPRDIGNGQPLYLIVVVNDTFESAGAATVNIRLMSDDNPAIAPATANEHIATGAIPFGELKQGKGFSMALPAEGREYKRYLGIVITTGTAATTAGRLTAFLSMDPMGWKAYPEGK